MEKRSDKAPKHRLRGETKVRAVTQVNAIPASSTPPNENPVQLGLFSGPAFLLEVKPATRRKQTDKSASRRNGVKGDGTCQKIIEVTGETLPIPGIEAEHKRSKTGKGAYKGNRNGRPEDGQGVGGDHSTNERRDNRREGRVATSIMCAKQGKTTGLPPRGKAQSRSKTERLDKVRKLQRTLYRTAKSQPNRRFSLLYDKVCRLDILHEAWARVKANRGTAGIDKMAIETVREYGEERFVTEIQEELNTRNYRVFVVRRVNIPKPGQPGQTRPLGIPTVKDRVIQMAVKIVIEPLFDADFLACSYGFRPKRSARMALTAIVAGVKAGHRQVVDVDIRKYFDSIDHIKLMKLVEQRIGDTQVLRVIRAWLKAGIMEDGQVIHSIKGTPQGGVISPLLANIYLHEVDKAWRDNNAVKLVRYADDMVLLVKPGYEVKQVWECLQQQLDGLSLMVNEEKSRLTNVEAGFRFLGFEFGMRNGRLYLWPSAKAVKHLGERIREVIRDTPTSERLHQLIRRLNPILIGWCTYFRVGHSNRVFHRVDWYVRITVQIWLRRKYQMPMYKAAKRWDYRQLHEKYRLYRMVGKVSHLKGI